MVGAPIRGATMRKAAMASPKTRRTGTAKKSPAPKKRSVKKPAAKNPAAKATKKAATKPAARRKKSTGFGRVRVPVDARLDLVFQKDYQARESSTFSRCNRSASWSNSPRTKSSSG